MEINSFQSVELSTHAYCSNFLDFDIKTRQFLSYFIHISSSRATPIKAEVIFTLFLTLDLFLSVNMTLKVFSLWMKYSNQYDNTPHSNSHCRYITNAKQFSTDFTNDLFLCCFDDSHYVNVQREIHRFCGIWQKQN